MPPQTPAITPGEGYVLGKYEVIRRLATGGMAEIFLARTLGIPDVEKIVVLKRMLPQLANQDEFVSMFLDEARIAAALHHPHIVLTFDVGVVDHQHFIAMEYCHGEDLRAILNASRAQKRHVPIEHAVHVIAAVCSALQHAHDLIGFDGQPLDIVHRDVSPQNVIVTYDGGVKLLDFGIAKSSNRFNETRYGTLKGKIGYMSPEQCRGEPIDRRSDVFAAGILLFELSTRRRLYRGASEFEVLKRIVEGAVPSPRRLDERYPEALDRIVVRALAKDPNDRFQSASELRLALEGFARDAGFSLTAASLAAFMEDVFARKIEAWREAQRAGKDLVAHLLDHTVDELAAGEGEPVELPQEDRDLDEIVPLMPLLPAAAAAANGAQPPPPEALRDDPAARASAQPASGASAAASPSQAAPRQPIAVKGWWIVGATSAIAASAITLAVMVAVSRLHAPALTPSTNPPLAGFVIAAATAARAPEPTMPSTPSTPVPVEAAPAVAAEPAPPPPPAEVFGLLQVATDPAGATLFVDGIREERVTPATLDRLAVGKEHILLAQLPGYADEVRRITIPSSGLVKLDLILRANPPPALRRPVAAPHAVVRGKLRHKRRRRHPG